MCEKAEKNGTAAEPDEIDTHDGYKNSVTDRMAKLFHHMWEGERMS